MRSEPYTAAYGKVWHAAPPTMFPRVTGRMFLRKMSNQDTEEDAPLNRPSGSRNMLATLDAEGGGGGRKNIMFVPPGWVYTAKEVHICCMNLVLCVTAECCYQNFDHVC